MSICVAERGIRLLTAQKLINRQGWKGKFALFSVLVTREGGGRGGGGGGKRADACTRSYSPPPLTIGGQEILQTEGEGDI